MEKYIKMYQEDYNLSNEELSVKSGISIERLLKIKSGEKEIKEMDAIGLSEAFETTKSLGLILQRNERNEK